MSESVSLSRDTLIPLIAALLLALRDEYVLVVPGMASARQAALHVAKEIVDHVRMGPTPRERADRFPF